MSTHCWQNGLDGALAIYYNDNGKDRCRFSFISPECLVNEQGFPKEKQTASDLYGLSKELYDHFSSIYKDQACYCVMLLSEHYYAEAYYIRGNAYLDKGKYDRAITDYNKAIELNPNFTLAYMNRGFVYLRKGNYDHAIEDGNKAVELKPDYPEAYSNRGEAQDERILNEKRRHGDRPFDVQPVPTAGVPDLNLTQFENEYLAQAFSEEVRIANDRNREEQLATTKMIVAADQPVATILGILTIGKNPQDFVPGAYLQFLRIDGSELTDDILDSEDIGGAIPDLLRRLDDKLRAHNRIAVNFTASAVEQRTVLYPIPALQQIIRNAIIHRTYEATNAPVHVSWFNDRIEVLSPGSAFGTVTVENFGQPGFTDYRNPNLAEAMRTLGYVQHYGMGIPIARKQLKATGLPEPEFKVHDNHVQVTIKSARKPEDAKP